MRREGGRKGGREGERGKCIYEKRGKEGGREGRWERQKGEMEK